MSAEPAVCCSYCIAGLKVSFIGAVNILLLDLHAPLPAGIKQVFGTRHTRQLIKCQRQRQCDC